MRYVEILNEHLMVRDSPAFQQWFGNSKVVDADGNPLPVYHGTRRPDRVGARFRKTRAMAGPMAFFTDDPTVASGYATGKADNSISEQDNHYPNWFKVQVGRSWVGMDRLWYFLSDSERREIAALAPRVTREEVFDVPGENHRYFIGPVGTDGLGAYGEHLRKARENVLMALVDEWLLSGSLYGDEEEFLKVLKLAGLKQSVKFDHPDATYPFVYQVFLAIQNPLVTSKIPQSVVDAFSNYVRRTRRRSNNSTATWEKDSNDPREWFQGLLNDLEHGTYYAWTVIPDWVTKILRNFGYDGIQDVGGKHQDRGHAVWIPFDEHQVKSAISNQHFRRDRLNIHH